MEVCTRMRSVDMQTWPACFARFGGELVRLERLGPGGGRGLGGWKG